MAPRFIVFGLCVFVSRLTCAGFGHLVCVCVVEVMISEYKVSLKCRVFIQKKKLVIYNVSQCVHAHSV